MTIFRRGSLCALVAGALALWAGASQALPPPAAAPASAAGKEDDAVRFVCLPRTKTAEPLGFYVARTRAKLPAALLLLCLDAGQDAKAILTDPAWQDFAEDNRLCLAAVNPASRAAASAKNAPPPSELSPGALVLQAADREFGAGMPLALYGWPQGAALAESLLADSPKRVLGWCFHAPDRLRDAGAATPPGILVCYKENKPLYDALTQDFARGRKLNERLTWITLPGERPGGSRFPALDAFVRGYFAALLHFKIGLDEWRNLETRQAVSAMDLNSRPGNSSYLPNAALLSAWMALHVPGGPEIAQQQIAEREVDTFNRAQPKLHLYLRKPLSAGQPGQKVEGVLAFCTWKADRKALMDRLQNRNDFLVRYAEEHRLALLTWDTAQAWSKVESADQRSHQENFEDNAGFDKLADAWERGVHALCYEKELPETGFLLYGISRGAQWAHRLALRKPQHFLAVHIHVNSSYDWPTPEARSILWLQTTGDREAGYEAAKRFYARCRELGYPIIFKAGENLGHSDSKQIDALGLRFFDYALGVKAKRDTLAAGAQTLRSRSSAPSFYAVSGMEEMPYYADFINQEVYSADQKDLIPASQRVPLPTKALAQAWGEVIESPALLLASNPAPVPGANPTAAIYPPPANKGNASYFGSAEPPGSPAPANRLAAASAAMPVAENGRQGQPAAQAQANPPPGTAATPPPVRSGFDEKYRGSIQRAVTEYPELAQAGSAPNATFLGEYQRLKESNNPLLEDPSWPEQVARIVREQKAIRPGFEPEFRLSVQRALTLYPALAEAGSPVNAAFLAEYHRLRDTGDALLADPSWPDQVARTVGERLASRPVGGEPLNPAK